MGREGAALGCSIQAAGLEEGFFLPQSHSWFFFSSPSAIKWNFTKVGYSCLLQDLPGSHAPPLGGCGESLRCGREEGSSHLGSAVCSYPGCQGRSVPRGSCAVLVPVLRDPYKPLAWLSLALSQTGSNQLRGGAGLPGATALRAGSAAAQPHHKQLPGLLCRSPRAADPVLQLYLLTWVLLHFHSSSLTGRAKL